MIFFSFKYRSSHLLQITIVIITVLVFSVMHFTDEETGDLRLAMWPAQNHCFFLVTKLYMTPCSLDCSPPGSSVHEIFQARIPVAETASYPPIIFQSVQLLLENGHLARGHTLQGPLSPIPLFFCSETGTKWLASSVYCARVSALNQDEFPVLCRLCDAGCLLATQHGTQTEKGPLTCSRLHCVAGIRWMEGWVQPGEAD